MFSQILLASDGSDNALRAAGAAAELTRKYGARLKVVHVFTPPSDFLAFASAPDEAVESPAVIESTQTAVAKRTGRILDEAKVEYEVVHEIGHPAERILHAAEAGHADLIIMGSRGLGAFKSFLLGSVSDRVLHHAHCAVLIVK